jgi:hypothetical protein
LNISTITTTQEQNYNQNQLLDKFLLVHLFS